jgi:hypothetical protein
MTPESRNSGERKSIASQRLAKNTLPEQRTEGTDRQRFGKHVSVTTARQQTISMVTDGLYKEPCGEARFRTCVEAGSNTSIVTLRVVGGDEKGSLKSETVKYGRESQGTRTLRKTVLARASSVYKRQTRPLVREGAPQKNKTANVKQ